MAIETRNGLLELLTRALPTGISFGTKAVNTQGYIESNVKKGVQFSVSYEMEFLSLETKYLSLRTPAGVNSVIIKTRLLSTNGGMRYTPRTGAVFAETGVPIVSKNLNDQSLNTSDVTMLEIDNVPTDMGIGFDVIRSAIGKKEDRQQGIFSGIGIERVLSKDEVYLLPFENLESEAIYIIFSITWFEGVPDLTPEL